MEIEWFYQVILLLVLLLLSAFFSGSEVAFFSIKQKNLDEDFKSSKLIHRYASNLIAFPRRLLITILVGNTLVNVAASIIAVSIALEIAYIYQVKVNVILTIQIILITIIILLFGELLPKVFASKHPNFSVKITAIPLYLFSLIIYPVSESITELIRLTFSKIKFDKSKSAISEKEISDLAELGHERGTLEEDEQEIISSFVEFKSVLVSEVMTPRVDIIAFPFNVSSEVLIETINKSGFSRFPVYKENLDKIIGIVHAKDLLPYLQNKSFVKAETIRKITRDVLFVPERKMISEMLKEFQQKKMHLAVVVDEFGGTSGLITLEDIIEEIIGEIWDEHDPEENSIKIISQDKISVLGKVPVTELNELIGTDLIPASDDYDTVAGLIINQAGHIPKEGYSFDLNNYKLTVKEVLKKRIKRIELDRVS
ncbi:MAG: hemolysin family protein [Ignavibacteriaceae bacterium]|nr:hemolysin family protein [Ignavibacteriaceae bacterium]MCU0413612.1 hemolysin family protein [Ignavibacteriaceae bacterium]